MKKRNFLGEKIRESARSVIPIMLIVLVICFTITPVGSDLMLAFLVGAALVSVGMGLFTVGAESAMTAIGTRIGSALTGSRKMWLIIVGSFALGIAITVAEPDLQVLAETAPHISNGVLIAAVSIGVGVFLSLCMVRIIFGIKLRWMLIGFYAVLFGLAAFTGEDFLSVAFDSGGVTTGPMTVPFILALGVGVANIRSDRRAEADSFGLVALCSIGPVLAVMVLGFFYHGGESSSSSVLVEWSDTAQLGWSYFAALPEYMKETAVALAPVMGIFLLFQVFSLHIKLRGFVRILLGVGFTYVGLVLFLTGVNVGFAPLGEALGAEIAQGRYAFILIPAAMLLGWFIISAEPAVRVLENQIAEVSAGAIPGSAMRISLSIAIAIATGVAMLRAVTGISLMWFLVPGYALALILTFFVPDIYTAIAFDSGGVASGPMTATFMLRFVMGACAAIGGNVISDAFGLVALVAMMPLITVQIMGVIFVRKQRAQAEQPAYGDCDVIELWG